MSIINVNLQEIKYGTFLLPMAIDVNNNLYLTHPAVETILNYRADSFREKLASKALKALLGKRLVFGKISGNILNKRTDGTPKVNLCAFDLFLIIAAWEAFSNGNTAVQELIVTGFADSLRSIALEQFGKSISVDERNDWIGFRRGSIDAFWQLGESIEIYKPKHPERSDSYRKFLYSNCQDRINRGLFGKPARTIREELKLPDHVLLRDHYNTLALSRLDKIQELASVQIIKQDLEPQESVKFALETFDYKVINYAK